MQKYLKEYLDELSKKQKKLRRSRIAIVILVVLVVTGIAGILSQYGVAMTGTAKCGIEEHQHGKDCYEKVLTCGMEEGEAHTHTEDCLYPAELTCGQEESEGHTHTEACLYPAELTCGQEESEEHTHTEECYTVPEGYACGLEESEGHTHTDDCYTVPEGYACGKEETEGHTHTGDCYTEQLVCGKEEHIHTDACYIDVSADVEDQTVWDNQYAQTEWKEAWGEDLAAAAQMQIGYKESINNYTVAENGSHKGYTRYGQFAGGDVYCDWDAAFVNFCMYYAGMKESGFFPEETDTSKWQEEFIKIREANAAYLTTPENYQPAVGDLVFFQKENEETTDQMGIVSAVNEEQRTIAVIEGNSENEVKENTYSLDDAENHIVGYLNITGLEAAYNELQNASEDGTEAASETENETAVVTPDTTESTEPMIELTTEVDGITITLSGPESSFEPADEYAIQAEKITEDDEKIETIEEAVEKVAEEKEQEVNEFQAFDIRLFADGEEVQPVGPVEVKFSGREVEKAVEDETTEVNVIHVDEETGEATDMEATATEENEVVIETDHFSVYVYVHLTGNLFGKAKVTVQHWSYNVKTIDGTADASKGEDTVFDKTAVAVKTKTEKKEIYSTDEISLPNESYFGAVENLSKLCNLEATHYDVEKIWVTTDWDNAEKQGISGGNEAWKDYVEIVLQNTSSSSDASDSSDTNSSSDTSGSSDTIGNNNNSNSSMTYIGEQDVQNTKAPITGDNKIEIKDNEIVIGDRSLEIKDSEKPVLIRFWYKANNGNNQSFDTPTVFYDYDLSSAKVSEADTNTPPTSMYTEEKGINSSTNYANSTAAKLGVGQQASGNLSSWADTAADSNGFLLNKGNGKHENGSAKIVQGIVNSELEGGKDGTLKFNFNAPRNLFSVVSGCTGSTQYTNYDLRFSRNGDTYTLQNVYDNTTHETVTGDLTKLTMYSKYESSTGSSYDFSANPVYSNNFWPLDKVDQNLRKDPLIGAKNGKYKCYSNNNSKSVLLGPSDDSKNHNWHFGMTYQINFTVGDYTGPMEYYFRGDDDFWLFIDGKLVVDIGGIHSAIGHSVNLRDWMSKKGMLNDLNETHTMKVYYMERGGAGSCCYMQFTIPNSQAVTIPTPETTTYTVTKEWDDQNSWNGTDSSLFRPKSITVRLQQVDTETGVAKDSDEVVELTEENEWTYTWTGLPKYQGSTGNEYEFSYRVEEVELLPGYKAELSNGNKTLTNKLVPVKVEVEKKWENDQGLEKYRPGSVKLRLYANGEPYQDDKGKEDNENGYREITLSEANEWKGFFDDLPEYYYVLESEDTGDSENTAEPEVGDNSETSGNPETPENTNEPENSAETGTSGDSEDSENVEDTDTASDGTYVAKRIEYSVREVVNGEVVDEGRTIDAASNSGVKYTVNYTENPVTESDTSNEEGETTEDDTTTGDSTTTEDGATTTENKCVATLTATNTLCTSFEIVKKGKVGEEILNPVKNAKFTLVPCDDGGNPIDKSNMGNTEGTGSGDEVVELKSYKGISGENGVITWQEDELLGETVSSIPKGTYLLKETNSPEGYALNAEEWIVNVQEYGRVEIKTKDGREIASTVEIKDGTHVFSYAFCDEVIYKLPSTGGSGIYWYMFGGVLFIAAASFIAYKTKHREVFGK